MNEIVVVCVKLLPDCASEISTQSLHLEGETIASDVNDDWKQFYLTRRQTIVEKWGKG